MSTEDKINPEEWRTEIVLFRYTLILPLLRGEYPPPGKGRLRHQIAARSYDIPHSFRRMVSVPTLARWERRYRHNGFEGLKPTPRGDQGQPRALSSQTLDRAEALKREQPLRSARSIVTILAMDATQPIPEETIAPRTLRRHPPGPTRRHYRSTFGRAASPTLPPLRAQSLRRPVAGRRHAWPQALSPWA